MLGLPSVKVYLRKERTTLEHENVVRFGMSSPPEVDTQSGTYGEQWTQWFLEQSFIRDFVYRNPKPKKGRELADALVLFNDVALPVHVKTQCGQHDPVSWATEKLLEALDQIKETHKQLKDRRVTKLTHELYGEHPFNPATYPNHIGLIILAQENVRPFDATIQVPELLTAGFPIHVFSLQDFKMLAGRCDTPADLITFLELRGELILRERFMVHKEEININRIIPHIPDLLERYMSPATPDEFDTTVTATVDTISGSLRSSPGYHFGRAIDDIIARAHDIQSADPVRRRKNLVVAEFLGWLSRIRRIALGKKFVEQCLQAKDGKPRSFVHAQPDCGTACVFLSTTEDRPTRLESLRRLIVEAQFKHGIPRCLGVATEPIGDKRSYDFALRETS